MAEKRWVEIVSLRSSSAEASREVQAVFRQACDEIRAMKREGVYAELYSNVSVETDLSIHLCWCFRSENKPSKTSLGISIAESFRYIGLVNHSIWNVL